MSDTFTEESYQAAIDSHIAGLKRAGLKTNCDLNVLEARDWLRLGEYSGNAYSIDSHRDDLLFHMATNCRGDFGVWIEGRFQEEEWSDWSPERKLSWISLIEFHWQCQFEFPIAIVPTCATNKGPRTFKRPESWTELYASRFFELAEELEIISEIFFNSLFSSSDDPDRFLIDCLFATYYSNEFINPTKPWSTFLPSSHFVVEYIEDGFFKFEACEKNASDAARLLNWDYWASNK